MRYFSTFTGIGGFELGIKKAYENIDRRKLSGKTAKNIRASRADDKGLRKRGKQNAVCVGYSEIDKYAIEIYQKHFPSHFNYGDITKINEKKLPDFDLLVGGFPCQSFSIAGKRQGFSDTRGTMFFEICRILKEKRPRLVLLENVKGLLSHDGGRTFAVIIASLDELGYDCEWQLLNSKGFGLAQSRDRVFIVGHLRGKSRPKVFPFLGTGEQDSRSSRKVRPIIAVREATKKGFATAGGGDSINVSNPNSKTRRGRVGKGIAQTIDTSTQLCVLEGGKLRKMTPLECERAQGFPDNWTKTGSNNKEISDTQRYKVCGNAAPTRMIASIIERAI